MPFHLHSDLSNPTAGTGADSVTKFNQYLDKAQEYGMESFCFSEHGSVFNWIKKKEEVEKRGMKYIHANEVYLTRHKDKEKGLIRDNYHYMLIAKNFEGVKELNVLTSNSFNRDDGSFYYNPRVSLDELYKTSDNIIMTSACLASPLWRAYKKKDEVYDELLQFFVKNKHRMFFEVQYHEHPEQIEFNKLLLNLSKETGVPLIAGTDTHSLNKEHQEARKIFLQSKGASYGDEDLFDLTFKSYDELVGMFEKQAAIPKLDYLEAINNTNVLANMVEEFTLDKSPKYPKLYDNSKEVFKEKINIGFKERGINQKPKDEKANYLNRIKEEYSVYEKLGAVDYMLLQKNIIDWCRDNDIFVGYGRGSVTGSLIAYLLHITEMDSIKHKLNFTRFLNPARVTLADIDADFPPTRRRDAIDYVASLKGVYFSEIITFNTMALKGSIDNIGKALKIPLPDVEKIKELAEFSPEKFSERYPEVAKYAKVLNGVIESVGSHPSGFLVSPIPLDENIATFYTKESKYPVSQVNMKELEANNYIKLDMLGLDNIEIINETCRLAEIDRLTPDNVDDLDEDVWNSMKESTLGVFQWESDTAYSYVRRMFDEKSIRKIKKKNKDFSYMNMLSAGNGAIRPAGASYRDMLADGEFKDNGHEGLNELLADTNGFLIYQEQINKFLTNFCKFTDAEADLVRRGLAKKSGTEEFLPKIEKGFIETMTSEYGMSEEDSALTLQSFLKVIEDASNYGFSVNHSQAYSYIGYVGAYLRYYYPLEFITVMLNVNSGDIEKTSKVINYAKSKSIEIKSIEYGKSSADYTLNREEQAIYKGIESIKFLNRKIAEELYQLSSKQHETFTELLMDIKDNTSVNSKQLEILIRLDFFKRFGDKYKLLTISREVLEGKNKYKKDHTEKTKEKRIPLLLQFEKELLESSEEVGKSVSEQIIFEKEILGYGQTTFPEVDDSFIMLVAVDTKYSPRLTFYKMNDGEEFVLKMSKPIYFKDEEVAIDVGDIIKVTNQETKPRKKLVNGKWTNLEETEEWLVGWRVLRKK